MKCACGQPMVEIDGHWICSEYFKIIKENTQNLQLAIEGGLSASEEDDNDGY